MSNCRARIALVLLLLIVCLTPIVNSQSGYRIVEVAVEGNKVASRSLILGVSSIDLGSPLTPTSTAETIRRLYGLGIFSDIKIEAEEVSGGLKLYIVVKELPKLSGIEFSGNDKISNEDLKDELLLGVGGYISPYLTETKRNEIQELYAAKGYFQAVVTSELEYTADSSKAILRYTIEEKSKVKVKEVILTGNERIVDKDVIKKMRNRKRGFLKSSDFAQDKYEEDLEKVIAEFHKKGFIDAYMVSDSMTIDNTINRMTIYLHVYEGPQYYFGKTTFANTKELPEQYLLRKTKFKEGEIFDIEKYDQTMEEIYSAYYDIGHLHIRLLDERKTREDTLIDIAYDITEGLPSHINLVKIVGNKKTKDHVIRREISTLPGQKFNRELLIRSVRDAMALNYFTNVNPVPIDLPNGDVDVEFQIEEKQTGQVSAGAGYNSQDKLVGNLGMGIPNFRGMGQNLSFNTDFGSRRSSFTLSFTEPWLYGRPTLFGADIYSTKRQWFSDYTENRQGASIKLGKRLRWPDNYFRVFTSYRLERDKYQDFDENFVLSQSYKDYHSYHQDAVDTSGATYFVMDTTYVENFPDQIESIDPHYVTRASSTEPYPGSILNYGERWNTASRISFSVTRDSRNLPEFATKGSKFSYTFEKTGGIMGGYWTYTKHNLSYAKFIPLFWNFALAVRTQFGAINSPNDSLILLSDRFTPGGVAYDGIVRGYNDGSLTPDSLINNRETTTYYYSDSTTIVNDNFDPDNPLAIIDSMVTTPADTTEFYTRVRGNYMLVTNIELQFPIVKQQIYGLLFFDAGNSWRELQEIKPIKQMYSSAGIGFRILVPGIGTIGFDFAKPFNNIRGQGNGWRTHFQMGTTFR